MLKISKFIEPAGTQTLQGQIPQMPKTHSRLISLQPNVKVIDDATKQFSQKLTHIGFKDVEDLQIHKARRGPNPTGLYRAL